MADLPKPVGSGPGHRRPVIIVQSPIAIDVGLNTLLVVPLTSNTGWANFTGNVLFPANTAGLSRESVANVTQLIAIDSKLLVDYLGHAPRRLLAQLDDGLRSILDIECPPTSYNRNVAY